MMAELKPCPFCGGKPKVKVCDGSGSFFSDIGTEVLFGRKMTHCLVICDRCRIRTNAYLTRRGVFNGCNRRTNNEAD